MNQPISSPSFTELFFRMINNSLKRFPLFAAIIFVPTLIAFIAVMVIKPTYSASAIVTPPKSSMTSLGGLTKLLSNSGEGMSSLLGLSMGGGEADAVWTLLNSWELHNKVIERFNLKEHYEFDGKFQADLLKAFRKNFKVTLNDESMFEITYRDKDYKLAAEVVVYILNEADSADNAFKNIQAKQSREYFDERLALCLQVLDSLKNEFVDFQVKNYFYEPQVQLESTVKYLANLQTVRDEVGLELAYERLHRGEGTKRYDELNKRYKSTSSAIYKALEGNQKNVGVVELKKTPELAATYMRFESEIKVQETLYKLLRQQSEEMQLEEAKTLKNLHVLQPPWPNDKKVRPLRGATLVFTFMVSFIFATFICNFLAYIDEEKKQDSAMAREWNRFWSFFRRKKD
jgi:capsule polysaccharide export protein KpsE/RkpR